MRSFEEQLAWGEESEKEISSMLMRRGVAVAPLYQFQNHDSAPILLGNDFQLTLPDLTCWSKGKNYFVECKRKSAWVKFNGRIETGLNQCHFSQYEEIKARTGADVFLFFTHEGELPGVYFNEIHRLKPHARLWDGMVGSVRYEKPLILFPKDALKEAATNHT